MELKNKPSALSARSFGVQLCGNSAVFLVILRHTRVHVQLLLHTQTNYVRAIVMETLDEMKRAIQAHNEVDIPVTLPHTIVSQVNEPRQTSLGFVVTQ